jgi:hypothetical protein
MGCLLVWTCGEGGLLAVASAPFICRPAEVFHKQSAHGHCFPVCCLQHCSESCWCGLLCGCEVALRQWQPYLLLHPGRMWPVCSGSVRAVMHGTCR